MNVLIIGGGIIGLTIAYELHRAGIREITVIDRSAAGSEASWAAAGMLAANAETETPDDFYEFCVNSAEMYPEFASGLLEATGIDVGYDDAGTLQVAFTNEQAERLDAKYERQTAAGLLPERLSAADVRGLEPQLSAEIRMGLYYSGDKRVDNRRLLAALLVYCRQNSIKIVENTTVRSIAVKEDRATGASTLTGEFPADVTIIATGAWTSLIEIGNTPATFSVTPVKGQMIAFDGAGIDLRHVVYGPDGYVVPRPEGRLLVGATVENAGFDKTVTEEAAVKLSRCVHELIPSAEGLRISEKWAGLRPLAPDERPLIGAVPGIEGCFIASAHYRNGILLAPITARVISDAVLGTARSPYLEIFSAGRFETRAAGSAARP